MTDVKVDATTASIALTVFVLIVTGLPYLLLSKIYLQYNPDRERIDSTQIPTRKNEQRSGWADSRIQLLTSSLSTQRTSVPAEVIKNEPQLKSMSSYSFRISDIPSSISEDQLRIFLEELTITNGERKNGENVLILSLAKSYSGTDSTRYQIATVTFRQVPGRLRSSTSQFETVSILITTGDKSTEVTFDSHFLGLTPLFGAQTPAVE
jgi:hypothetical protein